MNAVSLRLWLQILLTGKPGIWLCSAFVFFLSFGLHLPFFWAPAEVIFDEYHFGKFINAYCCSKATIFDIHPPHPKLIMAWLVHQAGYIGNQGFNTIGEAYLPGSPMWAFRLWPALLGSGIPVLGFCLLRVWGTGIPWALAGGLALALENSLLLETGIIALDGQLIFGSMAALLFCELLLTESRFWRRCFQGFFVGFFLAFAVSAKFTGLAAIGVVGVRLAAQFFVRGFSFEAGIRSLALLTFAGVGFVTWYLPGWWLHFSLLNKPGPGSSFYVATGNFWTDLVQMHKIMVTANNSITTVHPWQSQWWQWPLMRKAIYYWNSKDLKIYLVGNPWVWWGSHVAVFTLFWTRRNTMAIVLLIAWLGSYLPYALVSRGLFLYHYQPPLVWMILLATLLLARGSSRQPWRPWHTIAMTFAGFILVAPVTYGWFWWMQLPIRVLDLH